MDERTGVIDRQATESKRRKLKKEWRREEIFIDQETQPFARGAFRTVRLDEQIP